MRALVTRLVHVWVYVRIVVMRVVMLVLDMLVLVRRVRVCVSLVAVRVLVLMRCLMGVLGHRGPFLFSGSDGETVSPESPALTCEPSRIL